MSERTGFGPHVRVLASPRKVDGSQPLVEGPVCPLCLKEVDLMGVDAVVAGGGAYEETATGLRCPCGWEFHLMPEGRR